MDVERLNKGAFSTVGTVEKRPQHKIRVLTVGPIPPSYGGKTSGGVTTYLLGLYRCFPSYVQRYLFATNSDESLVKRDKLEIFDGVYTYPTGKVRFDKVLFFNLPEIIELSVALRFNPLKLCFFPIPLYKVIEEVKPAVIHVNHIEKNALYLNIANRHNIPTVGTIHSFNSLKVAKSSSRRQMSRIIHYNKDRVAALTSVSSYVMEEARLLFGSCTNNILIPNGVDRALFAPDSKRAACDRLNMTDKKTNILYTGNLIERKAVHHLLKAVAKVDGRKDLQLLIVGDGPERGKLEQLSMKLGLKGSAFFFGQRDGTEMPDWYNACDIFVLPSRDEGLSLSLLEAMSCARPVITAVPAVGCYDAVIDGETGFYFRYGDIHELIEKLNLLIHSEHLRRQIGHNARDLVAKKFAWGKVAEEMLSVFESVLKV